jgi:hypothetical protein
MFRAIARTFVLAASLVGAAHVAGVTTEARAQRPVAPNVSYTVVYYHVNYPRQLMYIPVGSSYAQALRIMHGINSYPNYRAYLVWR